MDNEQVAKIETIVHDKGGSHNCSNCGQQVYLTPEPPKRCPKCGYTFVMGGIVDADFGGSDF